MAHTFENLQLALGECTGYDLIQRYDEDQDEYVLIDPYSDQDGEPFYDLYDVEMYITNNEAVDAYLGNLSTEN